MPVQECEKSVTSIGPLEMPYGIQLKFGLLHFLGGGCGIDDPGNEFGRSGWFAFA